MNKWKHITREQRNTIHSCISHNYKLVKIGKLLLLDPTSISKEVKRNRMPVYYNDQNRFCNRLKRWPYVCSSCPKRYKQCGYSKYKYDPKEAQKKADNNLVNSRRRIDLDNDEFKKLDKLIKDGINNNKSIYQIKIENKEQINKSVTTLYRYINNGYLTTKRIDLPYAVKYKKRKINKKYDYSNNTIDRTGHTYLDYLSYIYKNPRAKVWQLDFLGSIKTDSKSILSFILPDLHFFIIDIIQNPNSDRVVKFFDYIEEKIGIDAFVELIPAILTDRDPCFNDINGICFSKITGEERCKIFFCDPYVSNQKPHVENMNKQLRKYFPKGKSIDRYTKQDIISFNLNMINTPVRSLDGYTPKDAFIKIYGEDLFNNLFK